MASALPHDQDRLVTRWTLNEIVATLLEALNTEALSRSSVWRILHDVDLKPHKSEYWLNSHDEDFETKAHAHLPAVRQGAGVLSTRAPGDLLR